MAIATDRVSYSRTPDRWNVKSLMMAGAVFAAFVLVLSFALFFVGRNVLGLPLPQLQTPVFVMLVATGQGSVYLIRERGHLWQSRPGAWLLVSSIADLAVVALIATVGLLMAPVKPLLIAELLAAVQYLLILDQFKVLIFRRFKIR